jgi:hypothetical protein
MASEPADESFYDERFTSLSERLSAARRVEGLDQEIALIRSRLNVEVQEHRDRIDIDTVLKCVQMIVRGIAQRHRMQPTDAKAFEAAAIETTKTLCAQLLPPGEAQDDG